jgi:membrane fusion protein (multidrug efflux system)
MNKKLKQGLTFVMIFSVVVVIAYPKLMPLFNTQNKNSKGLTQKKMAERKTLTVSGYLIKPQKLSEYVKATGTLRPDEEVDMSFETSGKIISIKFTEGTRVQKGELLAKINDKPLQAQLQKLQAQKALSQAKEFRQRSLLDKDAISRESYDQIVTELQTLEADINLIQARISETELRAPFDGIIGLRFLSEGAYATPATKIAKLIKISPLKIEFSIPERYASEIKKGYPISFRIDGSNVDYQAMVYAVDPKIDIETRTIALRALYANDEEELKSGRYASITLQMSNIDNAIAIPNEALIPEMEGEKVFVTRNGKAVSRNVRTGLRTESQVQILSGLQIGDTLLVTGILQLRENLPIVFDTLLNNN